MSHDRRQHDGAATPAVSGSPNRSALPMRIALAIGLATLVSGCTSSAPSSRQSSFSGRTSHAAIAPSDASIGEAALDDALLDPSRREHSNRQGAAALRTSSTWLQVDIAGGRTWLNLDRVESIVRPSSLTPAGQLPILVIHFGSGRRVELAFDDDDQRIDTLRQLEAALTIAASGP